MSQAVNSQSSETDQPMEAYYQDLRYIKLRDGDSKLPLEKWGGYSQDFDEAEDVMTHDEVVESPHQRWGIVGMEDTPHRPWSLLIFDIDAYEMDDDVISRGTVSDRTLVTRSQSGGLHVYAAVQTHRGAFTESDFEVVDDALKIDIRGSAVSHHVVAPTEIPGVDTDYTVVEDTSIKSVSNPEDACKLVKIDGEPAIEFNPGPSASGRVDIDRPDDPPSDLPRCLQRCLEIRHAAPDGVNSHKVNLFAALIGLYSGYSIGELVELLCEEYPPVDGSDRSDVETTKYQLNHIKNNVDNGEYAPPTIDSLREYGILGDDEGCECDIHEEMGPDNPVFAAIDELDPVTVAEELGVRLVLATQVDGDPVALAAIDLGILDPDDAHFGCVSGSDWWHCVGYLRDCGFDIPYGDDPEDSGGDGE